MTAQTEVSQTSSPFLHFQLRSVDVYHSMAQVVFTPPGATGLDFKEFIIAEARRIETKRQEEAARSFASRLRGHPHVREIWMHEASPTIVMAIVTDEESLDDELELRALFAEVASQYPAELEVFPEEEDLAGRARFGIRLLP